MEFWLSAVVTSKILFQYRLKHSGRDWTCTICC